MQSQTANVARARCRQLAIPSRSRPLHRCRIQASTTALPPKFKKVNPVGERVFVKVQQTDMRTAGGLVLPSSAQKDSTQGEVTNVSEGCTLKIGDQVVYGKYSGTDLTVDDKPHVLLKEEDVVGVMVSTKMSDMKPMGDRILVKVSETEDTTSAGVLLTASATEKPTFGTVLSVGPGRKTDDKQTPPNVKVGSTILYSQYSGTELQGEDEAEYIIIREGEVLAELS